VTTVEVDRPGVLRWVEASLCAASTTCTSGLVVPFTFCDIYRSAICSYPSEGIRTFFLSAAKASSSAASETDNVPAGVDMSEKCVM